MDYGVVLFNIIKVRRFKSIDDFFFFGWRGFKGTSFRYEFPVKVEVKY